MATTQHYLWASGHFLLLLSSLRCFLAWAALKNVSAWWYKASFTGALISYAIVCQKSLGNPQLNIAYLKRAMLDENVQYFILALFWWSSKPVAFALVPYMIFSLFHALTFTRTTLMAQFLKPAPPATAGGPPQPPPLAKKLHAWVKANYDPAMKFVAVVELLIFARVLLGALAFQNSLLSPIVYAHFLRQRYYQSQFSRDAIVMISTMVEQIVRRPGIPPIILTIWEKGQMLVQRWAGVVLAQNGAPQ